LAGFSQSFHRLQSSAHRSPKPNVLVLAVPATSMKRLTIPAGEAGVQR
jgi:hypothetical protein